MGTISCYFCLKVGASPSLLGFVIVFGASFSLFLLGFVIYIFFYSILTSPHPNLYPQPIYRLPPLSGVAPARVNGGSQGVRPKRGGWGGDQCRVHPRGVVVVLGRKRRGSQTIVVKQRVSTRHIQTRLKLFCYEFIIHPRSRSLAPSPHAHAHAHAHTAGSAQKEALNCLQRPGQNTSRSLQQDR